MTSYKVLLEKISTFIFDVDGVFTDSNIILMPNGEQLRTMSTRDGYALQYAIKKNYNVCIITGGKSEAVIKRFIQLGVKEENIHIGVKDKVSILNNFMQSKKLRREEVLYMGDDLPDYDAMKLVGLATCPKNSVPEILEIADYISHIDGGKGCVRDIIEQTLRVQKKWFITTIIPSI